MLWVTPGASGTIKPVRLIEAEQSFAILYRRAAFIELANNAFERAPTSCSGGWLASRCIAGHCMRP